MQQLAALGFFFKLVQTGEFAFAGGVRFEDQLLRAAGRVRRDKRTAGIFVGDGIGRAKFFFERCGEQNLFGEGTQFHRRRATNSGGFWKLKTAA